MSVNDAITQMLSGEARGINWGQGGLNDPRWAGEGEVQDAWSGNRYGVKHNSDGHLTADNGQSAIGWGVRLKGCERRIDCCENQPDGRQRA